MKDSKDLPKAQSMAIWILVIRKIRLVFENARPRPENRETRLPRPAGTTRQAASCDIDADIMEVPPGGLSDRYPSDRSLEAVDRPRVVDQEMAAAFAITPR
jgi:hypothetical protein